MNSDRRTRSGKVFSPWHKQVHSVPVDLRDLLEKAAQSQLQGSKVLLGDSPPAAGNIVKASPFRQLGSGVDSGLPSEDNCTIQGCVDGNSGGGQHDVPMKAGAGNGLVEIPLDPACTQNEAPTPPNRSATRSERNKLYHKAKRQKRRLQSQSNGSNPYAKKIAQRRVMEAHAHIIEDANLGQLRHANPGYVGMRSSQLSIGPDVTTAVKAIDDLIETGYTYIPWDGISGLIVSDCKGRGVVYGGSPQDASTWAVVASNCADRIQEARDRCSFKHTEEVHRRGDFPALAYGISYGQGQPEPMRLSNSKINNRSLEGLLADSDVKRVAGFQGQLFRTFAPNLCQYYNETLTSIEEKHNLTRNFKCSDYASITVNFGPRTVSVPHYDTANLAYGFCAITALGDFNPDTSGFIVLRELRLVLRFPPGSTLLVLSAIVQHYNLPIAKGERRYSVTQYSSGHLFRWVNNGFCVNAQRSEAADLRSELEWELGLEKLPIVCPAL